MTFEEIEAMAKKHEPLSQYASLTEKKCHFLLQRLYDLYRVQIIKADVAAKEERTIRQMFLSEQDTDMRRRDMYIQLQRSLISGQELMSATLKANSKEDMLQLALQCVDKLTGMDGVFYKTACKRIEVIGQECGHKKG